VTSRRCRGDDGISLVELMVAVGLMVLIVPLAFPMLTSTLTTASRLEVRSAAVDDLRIGLGNLSRELRGARCVLEPELASGTQHAEGDVLRFVTATADGDVEITYDATSGDLVRTTPSDSTVVAQGLSEGATVFEYTADPRQRVVVHLSLDLGDDREPASLDATTAPRTAWHAC
jgi:Tfp pilus assembly protein PilW